MPSLKGRLRSTSCALPLLGYSNYTAQAQASARLLCAGQQIICSLSEISLPYVSIPSVESITDYYIVYMMHAEKDTSGLGTGC